jgi:carboxylesterase type B
MHGGRMRIVTPATHALDQGYYFYVDEIQTPGGQININIHLARQFQRYLKNFILYGNPNGNGKHGYNQPPPWPNYNDSQVVNITSDTFVPTVDPWSLDNRCQFIRDLLQDPANGV